MTAKPDYQKMLDKLNELYDREDEFKKKIAEAFSDLNQVKEDIEILELMIMHQYNKEARKNVRR